MVVVGSRSELGREKQGEAAVDDGTSSSCSSPRFRLLPDEEVGRHFPPKTETDRSVSIATSISSSKTFVSDLGMPLVRWWW